MTYLMLIVGLGFLVAGGEALVRGSVGLAKRMGLSPFFIGAVLVGFGTSTPELVTSLAAARAGSPGVAVGNVVGSNIANIGLILGVASLIAVLEIDRMAIRRDLIALVASTILCVLLLQSPTLSPLVGVLFVAGLLTYVGVSFVLDQRQMGAAAQLHAAEGGAVAPATNRLWADGLIAVAGLVGVLIGAQLLVSSSITIARMVGLSETVIGLTIVAVGTSLPELAASVIAALKRQGAVAIGNVVGSNIFNILGILGLTALIKPIPVPADIARSDVWIMAAATAGLAALLWWRRKLDRVSGAVFLTAYVAYIVMLLV